MTLDTWRRLLAVAAITLLGAPWQAPGVPAASRAPASPARDLKPSQPVYRTGVDLVEVSVLVRDGEGRFVRGLDRTAFEILEEGVRQEIQAFDYVRVERRVRRSPSPDRPYTCTTFSVRSATMAVPVTLSPVMRSHAAR